MQKNVTQTLPSITFPTHVYVTAACGSAVVKTQDGLRRKQTPKIISALSKTKARERRKQKQRKGGKRDLLRYMC